MQIKTSPRVHVNPVRMAIICFLNKIWEQEGRTGSARKQR
jgi:hypothetical protein